MRKLLSRVQNIVNPLVRIKSGFSKVHLFDIPTTWRWLRTLRFGDDLILEIKYGGIGDHLFYSHLPEVLRKEQICKRVWISEFSAMRFPEIRSLVWGSNPHVAGFVKKGGWHNSGLRPAGGNFLDGLIAQFTDRVPAPTSTRPALYWPAKRPDRDAFWLWDFNRISNAHAVTVENVLNHVSLIWNNTSEILCYESTFLHLMLAQSPTLQAMRQDGRLKILPQEEKLDLYFLRIAQAARWFGFYSGGANIAAAYGVPATVYCEYYDPAISFSGTEYVHS